MGVVEGGGLREDSRNTKGARQGNKSGGVRKGLILRGKDNEREA